MTCGEISTSLDIERASRLTCFLTCALCLKDAVLLITSLFIWCFYMCHLSSLPFLHSCGRIIISCVFVFVS